ncbi:YceD family protein [Propionibacteriaceae bacterium G1746]
MNSSQHSIDARSPLVFEVHELGRRAGAMKQVTRTAPAPDGLGLEMIRVPQSSDITLDIKLESVIEGVYVSGTAEVDLVGECSRCLRPIEDGLDLDLQELYFYDDQDAEEDAFLVIDERVDLEPLIRDAVVLDLPFTPLCRQDCAGLCPVCGANLNDDPDHGHGDRIDPRWGKLLDLAEDQGAPTD